MVRSRTRIPVKTLCIASALLCLSAMTESTVWAQKQRVTVVNLTDRAGKFRIKSGDQERTYVLPKDSKIKPYSFDSFFIPPERKIYVATWIKTKNAKGYFKIFGGGSKPFRLRYMDGLLILFRLNGKYRMFKW